MNVIPWDQYLKSMFERLSSQSLNGVVHNKPNKAPGTNRHFMEDGLLDHLTSVGDMLTYLYECKKCTVMEISAYLGISAMSLSSKMDKLGIKRRPSGRKPRHSREELLNLRNEHNMSFKEMAKYLGDVTPSSIAHRFRRYNLVSNYKHGRRSGTTKLNVESLPNVQASKT